VDNLFLGSTSAPPRSLLSLGGRERSQGARRDPPALHLYIALFHIVLSRGFPAIVTYLRSVKHLFTLGRMLKAFIRWLWPKDAEKTQSVRQERYVTPEQLELALEKHAREQEFEMNEWYDKFNTLHLRLTKREKRKATAVEQEQLEDEQSAPSIIHLRRFGSP
jgi:hypothetical protein